MSQCPPSRLRAIVGKKTSSISPLSVQSFPPGQSLIMSLNLFCCLLNICSTWIGVLSFDIFFLSCSFLHGLMLFHWTFSFLSVSLVTRVSLNIFLSFYFFGHKGGEGFFNSADWQQPGLTGWLDSFSCCKKEWAKPYVLLEILSNRRVARLLLRLKLSVPNYFEIQNFSRQNSLDLAPRNLFAFWLSILINSGHEPSPSCSQTHTRACHMPIWQSRLN